MRKSSKIDEKLKAWSAAVDHELADKTPSAPRIPSVLPSASRRPLPLFPALLAAAALLAVFLAGPWRTAPTVDAPEIPMLATNGFEGLKPYFQELARLFPERVLWLSDEGTGLEVTGLDRPSDQEMLVLRVELHEEGPDGSWHAVWQRDVLTRDEAWVELPNPANSADAASFWIVGLDSGSWLVETHLTLPGLFNSSVRKQLTLRRSSGDAADAQVEVAPGVRMVQRLLPLGEALNGESA